MPKTPGTPKKARARKAPGWQARFLAALADTHLVTEACERGGVPRSTAYRHRDSDAEFAAAWGEIEERSTELLEREAFRRAAVGVEKPVFQGGELVGRVREFSDTLMIFLLKARRPDVYRDNHRVEHTGPEGGPISTEVAVTDKARSDAAREYLRAIDGD